MLLNEEIGAKKVYKNTWFFGFIPCLFAIMLLSSCGTREMAPGDLVNWVEAEKNGLKQEKVIGDIIYIIQYKPMDYIVAKELRKKNISRKERESLRKELGEMKYFNLRLAPKDKHTEVMTMGIHSQNEYLQRSDYFSYAFQNNIKLIHGKDTIPCTLFNNVRNFGLAPHMDFALGFEDNNSSNEPSQTLLIYDQVYGGGLVKMEIKNKDILATPALITQ